MNSTEGRTRTRAAMAAAVEPTARRSVTRPLHQLPMQARTPGLASSRPRLRTSRRRRRRVPEPVAKFSSSCHWEVTLCSVGAYLWRRAHTPGSGREISGAQGIAMSGFRNPTRSATRIGLGDGVHLVKSIWWGINPRVCPLAAVAPGGLQGRGVRVAGISSGIGAAEESLLYCNTLKLLYRSPQSLRHEVAGFAGFA